jgi:hypothetical protein
MSDMPRVELLRNGRNRLVRGWAGVGDESARLSTVIFTPQEWQAVTDAVLDQYNLVTRERALRERGPIYDEVERAQATIASLERELTYASGQDDDVADPPPLAAHGTEWAS